MSEISRETLKDRSVVITGASSGIGAATAAALFAAGMKPLLVARSEHKLRDIVGDLPGAEVFAADITEDGAPEAAIGFAKEKFGRVDALINNAGMMSVGIVDELDLEKSMAMVRLNVEAAFRFAILAAREMKANGEGDIVNVSSIAGIKTSPGLSVYDGTKFAIEGFSDALRMELAPHGVRVCAVEPGTVNTALFDDWPKEKGDMIRSSGGLMPEDIARSIQFMLEQPRRMNVARVLTLPSHHSI